MRRLASGRAGHLPVGAAGGRHPPPAGSAGTDLTWRPLVDLPALVTMPWRCRATLADVTSRVPVLLSSSSVFPEPTAAAFETGRGARLRRRRGDGLDRRGQPGRGRAARASSDALRRAGAARCTRPACWSPSGCGAPTRGSGCAGPPSWPRRWARRPSWCTRRSPGSATTPATSPTGLATARATGSPGMRFAVENMYPVRMAGPAVRAVRAGLGPDRGRLRRVHAGPVALRGRRAPTRWRWPTAMGAGLAHVHLGDGTGEGRDEHLVPGPRHPALRASCSPRWPGGASPASVAVEVATRRRQEPRGARGGPARGAGVRPPAPDRAVTGRRLTPSARPGGGGVS